MAKAKLYFLCSAMVVLLSSCSGYSETDRAADIAKLKSMKEALDSDRRGLETFESDRDEGKPISSDRYNFYLQIKQEFENGVSSYNELAKKTDSPPYDNQKE